MDIFAGVPLMSPKQGYNTQSDGAVAIHPFLATWPGLGSGCGGTFPKMSQDCHAHDPGNELWE